MTKVNFSPFLKLYYIALRFLPNNPIHRASPDTYSPNIGNSNSHFSCGVQNRWFYLLAEGAVGLDDMYNDNLQLIRVCGIGREKAAAITYRSLTTYLTQNADYAAARLGSLQAAIDLFGEGSFEYVQIQNAWTSVGVYPIGQYPVLEGNPIYNITTNTT